MIKETKNNDHQEGGICEQFIYFPDLIIYPNSSYMNELAEIQHAAYKNETTKRR